MLPKFLILVLSYLISASVVTAQSYFTAGGLRLGGDYGLSLKQRITKKTTVEAILFSNDNGKSNLGLALLADKHKAILTRNFNLFYGAGFSWHSEYVNRETLEKRTSFGIPLQAGIEFTIGKINLSWDFTPILYIGANSTSFSRLKGLSVRYVFLNNKKGKHIVKKLKWPFGKHKK